MIPYFQFYATGDGPTPGITGVSEAINTLLLNISLAKDHYIKLIQVGFQPVILHPNKNVCQTFQQLGDSSQWVNLKMIHCAEYWTMLGWGWGKAELVVEGENKWEKNNHVVLPLRRILDNNQQTLIISFLG